MLKTEAESSKIVLMPTMMTDTTTPLEELANMKAIQEKLTRESAEKEVRIKLQEEKIAKLTRKLEKRTTQSSSKDSEREDSGKVSVHTEAFDNEKQPKKGITSKNVKSSESMTIEQIQDLIANTVEA